VFLFLLDETTSPGGFVDRAGESASMLSPAFTILSAFKSLGKNYKSLRETSSATGELFLIPKLSANRTLGRPATKNAGSAPASAQLLR
jgi:hypothetical protein